MVRNPAYFLEQSPEHARIDPDQLLILLDHIRCAAFELPFTEADRYGERDIGEFLEYLTEEGVLHRDGRRWHWIDDSYPANAINLRSVLEWTLRRIAELNAWPGIEKTPIFERGDVLYDVSRLVLAT